MCIYLANFSKKNLGLLWLGILDSYTKLWNETLGPRI